jgi:hypothetical protein
MGGAVLVNAHGTPSLKRLCRAAFFRMGIQCNGRVALWQGAVGRLISMNISTIDRTVTVWVRTMFDLRRC